MEEGMDSSGPVIKIHMCQPPFHLSTLLIM